MVMISGNLLDSATAVSFGLMTLCDFAKSMPGTMFYTIDQDELLSLTDDKFTFFSNKEQRVSNISGCNVHVMNKFSLHRIIENDY